MPPIGPHEQGHLQVHQRDALRPQLALERLVIRAGGGSPGPALHPILPGDAFHSRGCGQVERTLARAVQTGQGQRFGGRLEDDRVLTIGQMVLISAEAQGRAFAHQNLQLQMVFECQDMHLGL